jgi:hypothetical protein
MEVTPLKGSGGDVQHFADRIIAERGVPYGRVAMIPTSAKNKAPPERTFDERDAGGRMSVPGQIASFWSSADYFRSSSGNGHRQGRSPCLKGARKRHRAHGLTGRVAKVEVLRDVADEHGP